MRNIRTDLALERHERLPQTSRAGVSMQRETLSGAVLSKITVQTPAAAEALGKPTGVYYTLELEAFPDADALTDARLHALIKALSALLPPEGPVLVAGLGNRAITPDALGPRCADLVFATRHIGKETLKSLSLPALREVSAVSPGVTGQTGLEAAELITAVCENVRGDRHRCMGRRQRAAACKNRAALLRRGGAGQRRGQRAARH